MGRLYTNTSGLNEAVSGFMEGRKFKQDEAYRKALEMMKAEEFAKKDLGGFQKRVVGPEGYTTGFEVNQENVDQAVKRYPEAYLRKEIPGTPAMPDPAVQDAKNASTERARLAALEEAKRMGTPTDPFLTPPSPGAPAPVSAPASPQIDYAKPVTEALSPRPLLKAKDELLPGEAPDISAAKVPIGSKTPTGRPNEFVSSDVSRAEFTDRPVVGQTADNKMLPATPPVQDPTLPTLEQMAAIDRQRFSGQKDAITSVSMGEYPPAFRVALGFPADYTGTVNKDVLIKMIDNLKQKTLKQNEIIAPDIIDTIKVIEAGVPLSEALDKLYETRGGAGFSPREMSHLQRAEDARTKKINTKDAKDFRDKEAEIKKQQLSPKNEERLISLDRLENSIKNAQALVSSGRVKPRRALNIARSMNLFAGGIPLDAANATLAGFGYEPLSNDEIQFLKLTSNANLSKLIETAGTTFTDRFGSIIQGLGSDISDPERFNQNTEYALQEIDTSRNSIVNIGQSNRAGKIREQQGVGASKKEPGSHAPKEEDRGPKPSKWNASMLRAEKDLAQKAIDAAKKGKNPEMEISWIKKTFKENTGVDFDGK